jgi:hypothetical protein
MRHRRWSSARAPRPRCNSSLRFAPGEPSPDDGRQRFEPSMGTHIAGFVVALEASTRASDFRVGSVVLVAIEDPSIGQCDGCVPVERGGVEWGDDLGGRSVERGLNVRGMAGLLVRGASRRSGERNMQATATPVPKRATGRFLRSWRGARRHLRGADLSRLGARRDVDFEHRCFRSQASAQLESRDAVPRQSGRGLFALGHVSKTAQTCRRELVGLVELLAGRGRPVGSCTIPKRTGGVPDRPHSRTGVGLWRRERASFPEKCAVVSVRRPSRSRCESIGPAGWSALGCDSADGAAVFAVRGSRSGSTGHACETRVFETKLPSSSASLSR